MLNQSPENLPCKKWLAYLYLWDMGFAAMIFSVLVDKEEQVGVSSPAVASSHDPSVPCNAGASANMPESLEIGLNQWSRSVCQLWGLQESLEP